MTKRDQRIAFVAAALNAGLAKDSRFISDWWATSQGHAYTQAQNLDRFSQYLGPCELETRYMQKHFQNPGLTA